MNDRRATLVMQRGWTCQIRARTCSPCGIPGIASADKTLDGVMRLRLDATMVACHLDKVTRRLKIAATWPWAPAIVTVWDRIGALAQAP